MPQRPVPSPIRPPTGGTSANPAWRPVVASVLALVLAGCAEQSAPRPTPPDATGGIPATGGTSPTSAAADCPSGPSQPTTATGTALRTTLVAFSGPNDQHNIVLPESAVPQVPGLSGTGRLDEAGVDFSKAFQAGAFTLGGALLALTLGNTTGDTVTVVDVRPVNVVRECLPLGAAILYGSEGGDPVTLGYDLDAAAPQAHELDPETGQELGRYFDRHHIELLVGAKQSLELGFGTALGAYSFDLALRYEVGGKVLTQLVRNGSQPFRVAMSLCPSPSLRKRISPADAARIRQLRYQHVHERGANFIVGPVPPEDFARQCETW